MRRSTDAASEKPGRPDKARCHRCSCAAQTSAVGTQANPRIVGMLRFSAARRCEGREPCRADGGTNSGGAAGAAGAYAASAAGAGRLVPSRAVMWSGDSGRA